MSDRTVTITLTAKDGVSKVFTQIARDGESMVAALKKAATDAERGLDDLGDSAQQAGRPLRDLKADAQNLGLGIGALVAGMALAGKSFRDQEIALESMRRGYGETAAEMERFAEQIQDTTNFSNDAAIASENIFRTLAQNYGFTADQIQQLITISADLAASMGIGLEDAAMRVQAAMRGEAESAEYLGLTLNDTALGIDNMAKSTSDAEKAQVRFNALQEQSAFAMGMAQQQADTTYGTMTQLRDSVQDAGQAFGDFLGPLGEVGAFAADNVVQLAAMGLALGQVGKAAAALRPLLGAAGLAGAIGPVGIAAAAVIGTAAILKFTDTLGESYAEAAERSTAATEDLTAAINALNAASDPLGGRAEGVADFLEGQANAAEALNQHYEDTVSLLDQLGNAQPVADDVFGGDRADDLADLQAYVNELEGLSALYEDVSANASLIADAQEAAANAFSQTSEGAQMAQRDILAYVAAFEAGAIDAATALKLIDEAGSQSGIENYQSRWDTALADIGGAFVDTGKIFGGVNADIASGVEETTAAFDEQAFAIAKANQTLEQYIQNQQIGGQNLAGEHRDAAAAIEAETEARKNGIIAMQAWLDIEQQIAGNSFAAGIDVDANAAMTETWLQAQELRVQAVRQEAIEVERLQTQYAETFGQMQAAATAATDTLDSVFRGIVGNTDAIAQQSQSVMDWAENLIAAEGAYGKIDDLLKRGDDDLRAAAISQEEYNAAQAAYYDIADANLRIQEDVLSIQAQLAPVVATANEALATQMDEIAGGSTDAQLFALGMMDAATASQALGLAQAYLSDQDTFGPMLQQAAELNPMLAQILEEMGLISYNPATGEVRLLGAEEAQSEIELLTGAMDDLNETVATLIAILQDDASGPIGAVQSLLDGLDGDTATVFANLIDNASGGIAAAHNALMALDGTSATAYITTIQQTIGGAGIFAEGGVIPAAAMGRVLRGATVVGEHGPELLLGGEGRGGMVVPATATSRSMSGGWDGDVIVNVHGNVGVDDLTEQITAKLVPALQRAVGINNAAYGGFA